MNHWNMTMTLLNKSTETRKLRAFLVAGKPQLIIGDTLFVVYPPSSTFHKSNAEKEVHLLEKALQKVTGLNMRARCVFEGEEPRGEAGGATGLTSSGTPNEAGTNAANAKGAGVAGTSGIPASSGAATNSGSTTTPSSSSQASATSQSAAHSNANIAYSSSYSNANVEDDPLVQKTLKIFGGKIIHIENE